MKAIRILVVISALGLMIAAANPAIAQRAEQRFDLPQDTTAPVRGGWSAVRAVKWGTLLASTGAVAYGFAQNRVADREYEDIERLCQSAPAQCVTKPDSREYADPALEARYQSVVRRDDRARMALLAGQIGLAASVLLFILDLPERSTPDDIPYDPRPLRLTLGAGQVALGYRVEIL